MEITLPKSLTQHQTLFPFKPKSNAHILKTLVYGMNQQGFKGIDYLQNPTIAYYVELIKNTKKKSYLLFDAAFVPDGMNLRQVIRCFEDLNVLYYDSSKAVGDIGKPYTVIRRGEIATIDVANYTAVEMAEFKQMMKKYEYLHDKE